jgi:hypothetical protein
VPPLTARRHCAASELDDPTGTGAARLNANQSRRGLPMARVRAALSDRAGLRSLRPQQRRRATDPKPDDEIGKVHRPFVLLPEEKRVEWAGRRSTTLASTQASSPRGPTEAASALGVSECHSKMELAPLWPRSRVNFLEKSLNRLPVAARNVLSTVLAILLRKTCKRGWRREWDSNPR